MKTNAMERRDAGAKLSTHLAPAGRMAPVTVHPVLRGDSKYLRALRAAEMAAWEANLPRALAESFAKSVATADREEREPESFAHSFGTFLV